MKKISRIVMSLVLLSSFLMVISATAANPNWNVSGAYVINVNYLGVDYPETLVLQQSFSSITGGSIELVGGGSLFTVNNGSVSGNIVSFDLTFSNNPGLRTRFTGVIAADGSMAGEWHDIQGDTRVGSWATTSGHAVAFTKDACKNGGWQSFIDPSFKNQGQCVSYFAQNK